MKSITSSHLYFEELEKMSLSPEWQTDYGLISFKYKNQIRYLFHSKLPLNSHLSTALTTNKHLTHIVLENASLPIIPYLLPDSIQQVHDFFEKHGPLIIKPTLGMKARNVVLIDSLADVEKSHFSLDDVIVEKFIRGTEYRYLFLKDKIIGVQQKNTTPQENSPWKKSFENKNESEWNKELIKLSLLACNALGLQFGAVDFIIDQNKQIWILEVNSAPGIKFFHTPDLGNSNPVAQQILQEVLKLY